MTTAPVRVLALPRYGRLGASSRLRWLQFEPPLAAAGLLLQTHALLDDAYLQRKYRRQPVLAEVLRGYWRRARLLAGGLGGTDVIWLEKELWPWAPAWLERWLLRGRPFVLDFDDAIFHTYDRHQNPLLRALYGRKIDRLMRAAALVVVGSPYLGERARAAGARRVESLPTVVDHSRYPQASASAGLADTDRPLRVGWIGSPATAHYVQRLAAPLAALARQRPVVLHLIGADIALSGVEVLPLPWSEEGETQAIAALDIGVMPLPDTPWEHGKCGYKLIQYMACGLPVVASPVGANPTIVEHGVDGFLADDDGAWLAALTQLAGDPALRHQMGEQGRAKVSARFSLQSAAPRLAGWLREISLAR